MKFSRKAEAAASSLLRIQIISEMEKGDQKEMMQLLATIYFLALSCQLVIAFPQGTGNFPLLKLMIWIARFALRSQRTCYVLPLPLAIEMLFCPISRHFLPHCTTFSLRPLFAPSTMIWIHLQRACLKRHLFKKLMAQFM